MRGHFLNYRAVAQLLLYVAIAVATILAAIWLIHREAYQPPTPKAVTATASSDALPRALARCQTIGTTAQTDHSCIAAWAENRRRFFGSAR